MFVLDNASVVCVVILDNLMIDMLCDLLTTPIYCQHTCTALLTNVLSCLSSHGLLDDLLILGAEIVCGCQKVILITIEYHSL